MLAIRNLAKRFGGVRAVDDVSLSLEAGGMRAIIGPNGCGKTTLFNLISGHIKPDAGTILFEGRSISGLELFQIARAGIVRKFQVPSVFAGLSVRDNLRAAGDGGADLVGRFGLAGVAAQEAGALAHGQKQWLELAMTIAAKPKLVLLDEPAAGMTEAERISTVDLLKELRRDLGLAIMLIEHDMKFVDALDCEVSVMAMGRVIAEGAYETLRDDPAVRAAYLGGAHA